VEQSVQEHVQRPQQLGINRDRGQKEHPLAKSVEVRGTEPIQLDR
jgi:hypothetical protein